jgi:hypothetical protein
MVDAWLAARRSISEAIVRSISGLGPPHRSSAAIARARPPVIEAGASTLGDARACRGEGAGQDLTMGCSVQAHFKRTGLPGGDRWSLGCAGSAKKGEADPASPGEPPARRGGDHLTVLGG